MFRPEWMEWWPNKPRIGPLLPESAIITCKSGGYLPVSGGQLALVMAKVTTTNHCGQNTAYGTHVCSEPHVSLGLRDGRWRTR